MYLAAFKGNILFLVKPVKTFLPGMQILNESDHDSGVKPTNIPLAIRPAFRNDSDQPVVAAR